MRIFQTQLDTPETSKKGWYVGTWNGTFPIPIGYATVGIDDPHLHTRVSEVFLVARGTARVRVEQETVTMQAGDVLILDPGEAHTFLTSSPDYFHFVLHVPGLSSADEIVAERQVVPRARLGLESGVGSSVQRGER